MTNSNPTDPHYNHLLRKMAGPFLLFREDLLDITTLEGSVVLSRLMEYSDLKKTAKGKDYTGWFRYTMQLFAKHLREPRQKTQARLLKKLATAGFIKIRYKGTPPKRWIKVDHYAINKAIDLVQGL